jgi:HAE1 family hydrophobic/amphiphilic exporter-1
MPVDFLAQNTRKFMEAVSQRPEVARIRTTWIPSVPQQYLYVDQDKVLKQGVELSDVYKTAQVFMGGSFVNYFNLFGRTWQTYVEANGPFRISPEDIGQFYVRNNIGNPYLFLRWYEWSRTLGRSLRCVTTFIDAPS